MKKIKEILKAYQPQPLGQEKEYAVLLPLVNVDQALHILYEVRAKHISQPGEVSFPGGRVEVGESYQAAAVRETMEELNLSIQDIEVLGEIDYLVNGKSTIRCFVGQLHVKLDSLQPNEEVARIFTVKLEELMAHPPKYYTLKSRLADNDDFPFERIHQGQNYKFSHQHRNIPFYNLEKENLWGLTAMLTHRFTEMIADNT